MLRNLRPWSYAPFRKLPEYRLPYLGFAFFGSAACIIGIGAPAHLVVGAGHFEQSDNYTRKRSPAHIRTVEGWTIRAGLYDALKGLYDSAPGPYKRSPARNS